MKSERRIYITALTILILSVGVALWGQNLQAASHRFHNVPYVQVSSRLFELSDDQQAASALKECQAELLEMERLLVRKGVDIVLETTKCSCTKKEEYPGDMQDIRGQCMGYVHFLN